jgi:hypothetical protein
MSEAPFKAGIFPPFVLEELATLGFGFGCCTEKLRSISDAGLDVPSLMPDPAAGANFGLDHNPPADADADAPPGLRLLCEYSLLEPELIVRRVLPSVLPQVLNGSPIENGESIGLFAPEDPVNRLRESSEGLGMTAGELACDCVGSLDGSLEGLRWSTEAMSFIS